MRFIIPGKPNSSKLLIDFPISSATPHEKPDALETRFINFDRYTWEDKDGEIIVRVQHDEKLMNLKSAQLEVQNERSFTLSIQSKEGKDKMYVLQVPYLFDAIVREKSYMLTTAKSLRVTLVKAEVAKVWKHLSSADSENTVLRLKSAPDGDKEINQES